MSMQLTRNCYFTNVTEIKVLEIIYLKLDESFKIKSIKSRTRWRQLGKMMRKRDNHCNGWKRSGNPVAPCMQQMREQSSADVCLSNCASHVRNVTQHNKYIYQYPKLCLEIFTFRQIFSKLYSMCAQKHVLILTSVPFIVTSFKEVCTTKPII